MRKPSAIDLLESWVVAWILKDSYAWWIDSNLFEVPIVTAVYFGT